MFSALLDEPRLTATIPVTSAGPIWPASDGKTVVMWTNGRLERWDVGLGRMIHRFPFRNFTAATMSGRGTLAVAASDGAVHFVEDDGRESGTSIHIPRSSPARILTFSPDGSKLAVVAGQVARRNTVDPTASVRLFDVATGARLDGTWPDHSQGVGAVAFSADGARLVVGGTDGLVVVHDIETGAILGPPVDVGSTVVTLVTDPVRPRIAVGTLATNLAVWDLDSGELLASLDGPAAAFGTFSPDGKQLAVDGSDAVRLYDAATLAPTADAPLAPQSGTGWSVLGADGRLFVSGNSGPVTVWEPDRDAGPLERPVPGSPSYLFPMPGGRVVVEPDLADSVTLLDARTLKPLGPPLSPGPAAKILPLPTTFAASYYDSRRIGVVNRAGRFQLFDVASRLPIGQPVELGFATIYAVFSRDMRTVAVGGRKGEVAIIDVSGPTPRLLHRNLATKMHVFVLSLEFDRRGDLFAADQSKAYRFSNVRSPHPHAEDLARLAYGSTGTDMGMDVSPDGRTVAVGHAGAVDLFDTASLRRRGPSIPTMNAPIAWLAYSRDGRYLVVNDASSSVRLVDTTAHQALGPRWRGLSGAGAVFNDDGRIVGTSTPSAGALMTIDPKVWRRDACALAGRNLTVAEWHQYLPGQGPRRRTCPQYP